MGEILATYVRKNININKLDYFVPVPLHPKRHHERGFNQADLLSLELSRHFGIPTMTGILNRTRHTIPQFDLHPKERMVNVRGAFSVRGGQHIQGKRLMLIDDIYTTGATVSECTRVLKDAGAEQVHILTLSRAVNL